MRLNSLLLAVLFVNVIPTVSFAGPDDLCVCQVGDSPSEQIPAFYAGCEAWLNMQLCIRKKIVSVEKPLLQVLEKGMKPRSLRIGYVGHWSSSQESIGFLENDVVPAVKKYGINVKVDNSACSATSNPYEILNFLNSVEEGSKIRFKGNQAISTGMWDMFTPGKNNFYAKIDGAKKTVEFPSCSKFENRVCYGVFQGDESAICHDKKADTHVIMTCTGNELEVIEDGAGPILKSGGIGVLKKLARWKRQPMEFFKHKSYDKSSTVTLSSPLGHQYSFESELESQEFIAKATRDARILLQLEAQKR